MGPLGMEPGALPKRRVKAYNVLGDVGEFQQRLQETLPPPKAPEPDTVFTVDSSEFPQDVWFAATIAPDKGAGVIASYRELCKARSLYQQQLNNIYSARRQHTLAASTGTFAFAAPGEATLNRTIAETMRVGADARKLDKFGQQQAKWDNVTAALVGKVGGNTQELAMQRGPAWRTRTELTELLYRAQPRDARGLNPDEVWTASLRDAWERIIPLGTIFTGLSIKIKERPHELPATRAARVGRPLEPLAPATSLFAVATGTSRLHYQQLAGSAAQGQSALPAGASLSLGRPPAAPRSLSARGRTWEDSELLRQRVADYSSKLRSLAPHDPDFGQLVVAGEALEGQLEALAHAAVTLAEVEAHLRQHDPQGFKAYQAVKDEMEAQLRAALEADEAERRAAEEAARAAAPLPGPHAELSSAGLSFGCAAGESASATVLLHSRGTAAVRWRWERRGVPQHPFAVTEVAEPPRFVCSKQSGQLLPGQSLELTVTFSAHGGAGTFREEWELVTEPPLQGPTPGLLLRLRGASEQSDESGVARAALEERLAAAEKMAKVAAALERVLRDVRAPRRPTPPESPEAAAAAEAWDRANGANGEGPHAWPPLFHSPKIHAQLAEVYNSANAALTAAVKPPAEDDAKKKKEVKKDTPRGKKAAEEPPPPPPKYPPSWDGRLATLEALLDELAAVAPAAAAPLTEQLAAAKAAARVPVSGRHVLRRAMRSLVSKLVDAVEAKFDTIRTDLEAKAAAEAAAAAAAAGEGEEGEGEGPALEAEASKAAKGKAAEAKAGKGQAKGGKAAAAEPEAVAPGSGLPSVVHLQPAFHEKAATAAKAVVKAQLNTLLDEVQRHKVAVGDALEAQVRDIDAQVAAVQEAHLRDSPQHGDDGGVLAAVFGRSAGGVPAPGPGPAAKVRSPALEQLYWDRLCVLRTWTGLGIPTRADIR